MAVTDLTATKAQRFLRLLSEEPFVCVVFTEEGELRLFSKGMDEEQLDRITTMLEASEEGDDA